MDATRPFWVSAGWFLAVGALVMAGVVLAFPIRTVDHVVEQRVVTPIPQRFGAGDLLELTQHLPAHLMRNSVDPTTGQRVVCVTTYNGDPHGGRPQVTASIEACYPDASPPKPMGRPEMP